MTQEQMQTKLLSLLRDLQTGVDSLCSGEAPLITIPRDSFRPLTLAKVPPYRPRVFDKAEGQPSEREGTGSVQGMTTNLLRDYALTVARVEKCYKVRMSPRLPGVPYRTDVMGIIVKNCELTVKIAGNIFPLRSIRLGKAGPQPRSRSSRPRHS